MKAVLGFIAGIILGVVLYVLPDMFGVISETLSATVKGVCAGILLIIGIGAWRSKKSTAAWLTLTACLALVLLIIFGGAIRLEELGIL